MSKRIVALFVYVVGVLSVTWAWGEGSPEVGLTQALRQETVLYVDIVDPEVESIRWVGVGDVFVFDPSDQALGSISPGGTVAAVPGLSGAYKLILTSNQNSDTEWGVEVVGQTDTLGRLFSKDWKFNAGCFEEVCGTQTSFYAVVPGGVEGQSAVIELKLEGLAGYVYDINANRIGVDGDDGGVSVPTSGQSVSPEFPIYLAPPTESTYSTSQPQVTDLGFDGANTTSVFGDPLQCNRILSGRSNGVFTFTSNIRGTYNLQCDLDRDGVYERSDSPDLLLIGTCDPGENEIQWDGLDNFGERVAPGTWSCRVQVNTGEFHYVGTDIETSYPGMRLFEVGSDGERLGLTMYWGDSRVQDRAVAMPNGDVGLATSGTDGIPSGDYENPAVPNVNARSWGHFAGDGKGNNSYLDTYTWLGSSLSSTIEVISEDDIDTDEDGLTDFEERCQYGTDHDDPDTDKDGTNDGEQYGPPEVEPGEEGGLESNGRLAEALAQRAAVRARFSPPRLQQSFSGFLDSLAPTEGPRGGNIVASTPYDLTTVTNALEVRGFDYLDRRGLRSSALLLIETQGDFYEHTRTICERSRGASVISTNPRSVEGGQVIETCMARRDGRLEYSASALLYASPDGGWDIASDWLQASLPRPSEGQRAITIMAWGNQPGDGAALLDAVLVKVGEQAPTRWLDPAPAAPAGFFRNASTLGGTLKLNVEAPQNAQIEAVAQVKLEDGTEDQIAFDLSVGSQTIELGPATEVSAILTIDGVPSDRVWLSDGTWIVLDDGLWGGMSQIVDRTMGDCPAASGAFEAWAQEADLGPNANRVRMSGCAEVRADVDLFAGLARHIGGIPINMNNPSGGLLFEARANRPFRVCLESSRLQSHACANAPATEGWQWVMIPLDTFELGPDTVLSPLPEVDLVTFLSLENGTQDLGIRRLSILETRPPTANPLEVPPSTARSEGCTTGTKQPASPMPLAAGAVLALLWMTLKRKAIF